MKFRMDGPLLVFCRLKGENGKVREVTGLVEPGFEYCCFLRGDAVYLGYPSVTSRPDDWADVYPDQVVRLLSFRGIEVGTIVKIKEVSIGPLRAENVEAVVTESEFPINIPVSMFIGRSFLKHFKFSVNFGEKWFSLEDKGETASRRLNSEKTRKKNQRM